MRDLEWEKTQSINGSWEWGSSFCNVKLACNYFVFDIMSRHLADNPQIKRIVELGTHTGGMALYLGMESVRMGIPFHTWDIEKQTTEDTDKLLNKLGVIQHIGDVFEEEVGIAALLSEEPVYLLCDGGNKHREVEMFAKYLHKDSIISSHDYGRELFDENLIETMKMVKMLPLRVWEWGEKNAQFITFKVI